MKKRIGIVSYEENEGIAFFQYDDNFINSDIEVPPIVMPLNKRVYSFPALNKETFKGLLGSLICAANMNISRQKAISIINEVQSAVKKWKEFALKANVNKEDIELIKKAIDKQVSDINI